MEAPLENVAMHPTGEERERVNTRQLWAVIENTSKRTRQVEGNIVHVYEHSGWNKYFRNNKRDYKPFHSDVAEEKTQQCCFF